MKVLKIIISIILKTISLPFLLIGLIGLLIYTKADDVYEFESYDDVYMSGPNRGLPKL